MITLTAYDSTTAISPFQTLTVQPVVSDLLYVHKVVTHVLIVKTEGRGIYSQAMPFIRMVYLHVDVTHSTLVSSVHMYIYTFSVHASDAHVYIEMLE